MPMRAHDLVRVELDLVKLQCFVQDFLERNEIAFRAENPRTQVRSVQGVVKPFSLICSR